MKLHQLAFKSAKKTKRVGRGIAAGGGKTAGRGTKGQKSRSGGNIPAYFEGGQNPLIHRLPKQKGFKSRRSKAQVIRTDQLAKFKTKQTLTAKELKAAGLIRNEHQPVKLLFNGPVKTALTIEVQGASQQAKAALVKAGGQAQIKALRAAPSKSE